MTLDFAASAAWVFVALLAAAAVFQLALALGAPWGAFAWGGQHKGTLPAGYRWGSAAAILVYALFAVVVLDRAGVVDALPEGFSGVAIWVIVAFLGLSVIMNGVSRSRPERFVMTPLSLVLALLVLVVALSGGAKTLYGTVIDDGSGPNLCTIVLTSYPPQCGDPTPISNWDWEAVDHESEGAVRWGGYYTFDGVEDDGVITVTGEVELSR